MFIRKRKYPSGNVGILVCEKVRGKLVELHRIGVATTKSEIESLVQQGKEWIDRDRFVANFDTTFDLTRSEVKERFGEELMH